jgi:hypothetical protein
MADFSIIECDGYPTCDVAHSEAAMADTMVVMLEDTNRAEHMLGDIMLRAWRMRSTVRVVFVKPKFDEIYKRKDSPRCVKSVCLLLIPGTELLRIHFALALWYMILLLLRSMAKALAHEKDAMFDEMYKELQDLRQHMKVSGCINKDDCVRCHC